MNLKRITDGNRDRDWAFLMVRYKMPDFIKKIQKILPKMICILTLVIRSMGLV